MVWMDNFYRRRLMHHPARGDVGLNTTVVSVLHTRRLPMFPGALSVARWVEGARRAARSVEKYMVVLMARVDVLFESALTEEDIRAPLDVRRVGVRPLQWRPFSVTGTTVGSTKGLLEMIQFMKMVASHTAAPMPLLVDINLWYRVQRLMYNPEFVAWEVEAVLDRMPPVFAMWHAYKHAVMVCEASEGCA